ncbi:MAG: hypothetical protein IJE18_02795 [Bacteroidaceae bacterium]|nr:hypothetical protein [Bacteroidaceae bacterium]
MKRTFFLTAIVVITLSLMSFSCEKETTQGLNKDKIEMLTNETYQLTYNAGECVWLSEQPLIASVENGLVTAHLVGKTNVCANDDACSVIVNPRYNTFREPLMGVDVTVEAVQQYMKDYDLLENEGGEEGVYAYISKDNTTMYTYSFNGPILEMAYVVLPEVSAEEVALFLKERYLPLDEEIEEAFISIDQQVMVGFLSDMGMNLVVYINVPAGQGFPEYESNMAKARQLIPVQ